MKIAHAIDMSALQMGGVEVLVRSLIAAAPEADKIFLISQDREDNLHASGWARRLSGHCRVPEGWISRAWTGELVAWLKHQGVELCHFHLGGTYGWQAGSLCSCPITAVARSGIPTVVTNHQAVSFFGEAGPPRPYWRSVAAVCKVWPGKARQLSSVHWEVAISRNDLAVSRRYYPMFRSKLIQAYHSRLDVDLDVSAPPPSKIILNVATLAFRKGQHVLVEAFARIAAEFPEWKLRLVGYQAEKACAEAIQKMIRAAGLEDRIVLCGPVAEPMPYFAEAEIYVQPSLIEGLGLSLQEAMFHGRACIGSNTGGIPELIDSPETGMLYPCGDVGALADALKRLMDNSRERDMLGRAARASVLAKGMTLQAMCDFYRELYQQTLAASRAKLPDYCYLRA